jgi:hypothetical protein
MTTTTVTLAELREQYDETLRELYGDKNGDVRIGYCTFDVAHALKRLDPTAYDIGLYEYVDSLGYVETATEGLYETIEDSRRHGGRSHDID